jgi:LPS sulfotransferase NodH
MKYTSYVICTSPRSGSTLLCKMLTDTGIAGKPASLFYRPSLDDWMTRMEVRPGTATEPELLDAIFQAAMAKGRSANGVFGLRQQAPSFGFLCGKLAVLHPAEATDLDRIARTFGPPLFVHLARPDKLGQAVSYLKAQQTGLWHVAADGSELERLEPHRNPEYDAETIRNCIDTMTDYDRGWNDWFEREGVDPLRISYDDLSADPVSILLSVLEHLGLDKRAADGIEPGVMKMADATSRDWIARFRAEAARPGDTA